MALKPSCHMSHAWAACHVCAQTWVDNSRGPCSANNPNSMTAASGAGVAPDRQRRTVRGVTSNSAAICGGVRPAAAIRSSMVQMSRYKRSQPIGQREKLLTALGAPAAFKCGHGRPIKQQITAADIVEAVHRSPFQPHAGLNVMGHKAALKGD